MSTLKNLSVVLITSLAASAASAAYLDVRQAYTSETSEYETRIKLGGSFDNHFFSVEANNQGKPFTDWARGDNEVEYGYNFEVNKYWSIQPSLPINFADDKRTFKPQVLFTHKFDSGITAKFRYRHEFESYIDGKSAIGRDGKEHTSLNRSKLTAWLGYDWKDFYFEVEGNWAEDYLNNEWANGNGYNGQYDYDINLMVTYQPQNWPVKPYFELGNIACMNNDEGDCNGETREERLRVGVTYNF